MQSKAQAGEGNVCCCFRLRASTWRSLRAVRGGVLGRVLEAVLLDDPIAPVLTAGHLQAVSRRADTALRAVDKCIQDRGLQAVIVQDD